MVEGQVALGAAILAAEFVAQEKIEAREGHALLGSDEILQHHDRGYAEFLPLAAHHLVIFGDDVDRSRTAALIASCQGQRLSG